jgi:hypothetical protein
VADGGAGATAEESVSSLFDQGNEHRHIFHGCAAAWLNGDRWQRRNILSL